MNILHYERICQSALARNAAWMIGGQGAGIVLQAVYFVISARLLGAVQCGVFAGALAFISSVVRYSALGTGAVLLRYGPSDRKRLLYVIGHIGLSTEARRIPSRVGL
jgi:O-antigen/teichoic acid export membrane protein